jgi:hypothetical protein
MLLTCVHVCIMCVCVCYASYRKAASRGSAKAAYNLACRKLRGEGVPVDVHGALALLQQAAAGGLDKPARVLQQLLRQQRETALGRAAERARAHAATQQPQQTAIAASASAADDDVQAKREKEKRQAAIRAQERHILEQQRRASVASVVPQESPSRLLRAEKKSLDAASPVEAVQASEEDGDLSDLMAGYLSGAIGNMQSKGATFDLPA